MGDILISAYACDPNTASEPIAGWAFLQAAININKNNQKIHLLTRDVLKKTILENIPENSRDNIHFHFIKLPRLLAFLEAPGIGIKARVGYLVWNHQAKKYLKTQSWIYDLSVAHHVTLSTEILPTPFAVLPKSVKTIWGPIGSSGNVKIFLLPPYSPKHFIAAIFQSLRNIFSPRIGRFFGRKIDVILCQTQKSVNIFSGSVKEVHYFTNQFLPHNKTLVTLNKLEDPEDQICEFFSNPKIVKVGIVGHLILRKRVDIALRFFSQKNFDNRFKLIVIGSKPKSAKLLPSSWKRKRTKESLNRNICYTGKLSRESVNEHMRNLDVLFHPAGREGAPFVVGEAISNGLPVVCFEGTGASDLVKSIQGAGIVIPATRDSLAELGRYFEEASNLDLKPSDYWPITRIEEFLQKIYAGR